MKIQIQDAANVWFAYNFTPSHEVYPMARTIEQHGRQDNKNEDGTAHMRPYVHSFIVKMKDTTKSVVPTPVHSITSLNIRIVLHPQRSTLESLERGIFASPYLRGTYEFHPQNGLIPNADLLL